MDPLTRWKNVITSALYDYIAANAVLLSLDPREELAMKGRSPERVEAGNRRRRYLHLVKEFGKWIFSRIGQTSNIKTFPQLEYDDLENINELIDALYVIPDKVRPRALFGSGYKKEIQTLSRNLRRKYTDFRSAWLDIADEKAYEHHREEIEKVPPALAESASERITKAGVSFGRSGDWGRVYYATEQLQDNYRYELNMNIDKSSSAVGLAYNMRYVEKALKEVDALLDNEAILAKTIEDLCHIDINRIFDSFSKMTSAHYSRRGPAFTTDPIQKAYSLPLNARLINRTGYLVAFDFNWLPQAPEDVTPETLLQRKMIESDYVANSGDERLKLGEHVITGVLPNGVESITRYVRRFGGGGDSNFVLVMREALKQTYDILTRAKVGHLFENRVFRVYGGKLHRPAEGRFDDSSLRPDDEPCGAYDPLTQEVWISDMNLAGETIATGKVRRWRPDDTRPRLPEHRGIVDLSSPVERATICATTLPQLVITLIHELGHAYYTEILTQEQKIRFATMYYNDRFEMIPGIEATQGCVSSRSVDEFEEDFAETFTLLLAYDVINRSHLGDRATKLSGFDRKKFYAYNEVAIERLLSSLNKKAASSLFRNFKKIKNQYCRAIAKSGRLCTKPVKQGYFCMAHKIKKHRGVPSDVIFPIQESVYSYMRALDGKGAAAIPELTQLYDHSSRDIAKATRRTLISIFTDLVEEQNLAELESAMLSHHKEITELARQALSDIHTEEAHNMLQHFAKSHPVSSERQRNSWALSNWDTRNRIFFEPKPKPSKLQKMLMEMFGTI